MEFSPTSAQRLALVALSRGTLQRTDHGWVVAGEREEQIVTVDVVRWLFGERYAELDPDAPQGVEAYRLTEPGRRAAREAREERDGGRNATAIQARLRNAPVLLLAPAAHSEEMDWLLAVRLGAADVARHRVRVHAAGDARAANPDHFEFIQYLDEIYALPMSPRAAELGLIPPPEDGFRLLLDGLDDPDQLGASACAERGVNYGSGWVQWFGGFDRESPLIIGERLDRAVVEEVVASADAIVRPELAPGPEPEPLGSPTEPADGGAPARPADRARSTTSRGTAPADPLAAWDEERARCPVTGRAGADRGVSARTRWSFEGAERTSVDSASDPDAAAPGDAAGPESWDVLGHAETLEVLHDHETYSSRVSMHLSVPSGMDPPVHGPYRRIVEEFFTAERMAGFEPACRSIAIDLVEAFAKRGGGDAMADLGTPFAVRIQCAFMGWPPAMHGALSAWQDANHRATRFADEVATAEVAQEFERRIRAVLERRRAWGDDAPDDPTTQLMRREVDGRPLNDDEIVSIIRNWTAGELGTIAASVGILLHALAHDHELQARLRADDALLLPAIEEILRVRGPVVAARRVATRDAELGGQEIAAADRIRIVWPAANRDPRAFDDADRVRIDREPSDNLLWGAGIHVCPGAPLAQLELRTLLDEFLRRSDIVEPDPERAAVFAAPPRGGFERVPVVVRR